MGLKIKAVTRDGITKYQVYGVLTNHVYKYCYGMKEAELYVLANPHLI